MTINLIEWIKWIEKILINVTLPDKLSTHQFNCVISYQRIWNKPIERLYWYYKLLYTYTYFMLNIISWIILLLLLLFIITYIMRTPLSSTTSTILSERVSISISHIHYVQWSACCCSTKLKVTRKLPDVVYSHSST